MWTGHTAQVTSMLDELFIRMGGNPAGVTMQQYITGMQGYVNARGRNIQLTSLRTGHNQLNEAQMKANFRNGNLMTLFASGFSIVAFDGIRTHSNHDIINHGTSTGNHIMMAYGYRRIRYYNAANQLIRNDLYVYVHTGFSSPVRALVPLYRFGYVYNALITRIF